MPVLRSARLLCALSMILSLAACEDNADKALATSQSCLNTATAANVDTCLIPVAGQTSAASYAIRCAADYLAQGFVASRLTGAFQDVNNGNASVKPILTAVAYMTFQENLPAGHTSTNAINNCALSQSDSYRRLSEFTKFATLMAPNSGTTAESTATAKSQVQSNVLNPSVDATVGAQTLILYQDFCVEKSPFSGTEICTTIETYKDYGTDTQIGAGIMAYIGN